MSQSPIRMQSVVKKSGVVDALPLAQPTRLFECLYKSSETVKGCFEGEEWHKDFVVQGKGPVVRFRGAEYELKKVHIHLGSEHIVEHEESHDMEIHFVHAPVGSSVASPLVVIGILFQKNAEPASRRSSLDKTFEKLLDGVKSQVCIEFKMLDLFPKLEGKADTRNWFHYEGSLTSFPYSENVSWIVMKNRANIQQSTIDAFEKHSKQKPRKVQPLDRRLVVRSFLVEEEQ